jgi:hypothetical protein
MLGKWETTGVRAKMGVFYNYTVLIFKKLIKKKTVKTKSYDIYRANKVEVGAGLYQLLGDLELALQSKKSSSKQMSSLILQYFSQIFY